jgi:thioredoxin reductase (NADPH)
MDVLQRAVAIVFGQFTESNSFFEVSFNRPDSTRQRFMIHVVEKDSKTCDCRNLGNTVAHRPGANHGNSLNRWRTASWATHAFRTGPATPSRLQTTKFDYLNVRSYTIRPTEKAILSMKMANDSTKRDVVIIGSGPAGLTAAIYTARASLKPLLIDAPADAAQQTTPGGQLMITTDVENYPGFSEGIQGPELMDEFRNQAERFGTEFMEGWITEVDLSERPFQIYIDNGPTISTETLIIATGASAKWLGIPGEAKVPEGFGGNGVSACATCDGPLPAFRNHRLIVVGGGDTAMEEATFLTRYAAKVYVVHRRDKLRASKIMQEKAFRNEKIEFIWNSAVDEILGTQEEGVTGVRLRNLLTGDERIFPCAGVFVAIGHRPNTELFKGQVDMDEIGYLKTSGHSTATNIPGVFACGDVQDSVYRQAVTAAGSGCMSAIDAERYLDHLPVAMPSGEEVTIEGEHITADRHAIITPDGHMIPNDSVAIGED